MQEKNICKHTREKKDVYYNNRIDEKETEDLSNLSEIEINPSGGSNRRSVNFGGGLELLMNDKQKASAGPSSDIDIDDLNNLENELNDLANTTAPSSNNFESGLFGSKLSFDDKPSVRFDETPSIGKST